MAKPLYMTLLFSIVLAAPAAAQTSGIAGTGLATPYGAVRLPATTVAPSTAAAGSGNSAAGASPAGGSRAAAGPSASATAAAPAPSASGGSSSAGATAGSNTVPAWLLCPPSGVSGMAPFLTGTSLSCAP